MIIRAVVLAIILGFVFCMLFTIPVWALWNWQMTKLGLPALDMAQVFWILIMLRLAITADFGFTLKSKQ